MNSDRPSRGETGEPVLITGFIYPTEEQEGALREADDMALLRLCLLVLVEGGHRDAIATRTVALARVIGLYSCDAHAALKIGVDTETVAKAKRRLLHAIRESSKRNPPFVRSPT